MTGIAVVLLLLRARPAESRQDDSDGDGLIARCPDARLRERAHGRWTIEEADLIEVASSLIVLASKTRDMLREEATDRGVELQRGCIALAARGLLAPARCDAIPVACFTSPARLFAWTCAVRSCREFGRRSSFFHAQYLRVLAKLDLSAEAWRELNDDTDAELDGAEALEVDHGAPAALLTAFRARRVLDWLVPVLSALDRGDPMIDTAQRLRQAADLFEGRHDHDRIQDDTDEGDDRR